MSIPWHAILIGLGIIALLIFISYFAVQSHLDRKAEQLQHGDEFDRQAARELREISRKIDQGRSYP
ncbi:hypothetical protein ACFQY8_03565 [Alloscardovia venturai]|uniref:Uncharacterized protein n=1 Tax=Alloscardovia venturai TaxID=1769421 RepID=A0ABW2Y6G1_9BIFI